MDSANIDKTSNRTTLSKKSWVAYIFPAVLILATGYFAFKFNYDPYGLIVIPLLLLVFGVYIVALNRSYKLFIDEAGIWIYSGVFPWNKGVNGVKWRDLDEAVYFTGFISWITRSYKIRLSHRFTKDSEIVLTHMALGNKAVIKINSLLEGSIKSDQ